jgi:hypothetical protein
MQALNTPPAQNPLTSHRLSGLEPDNMLALLVILGLLRALDLEKPSWGCRVHWDCERSPIRPVLSLREAVTEPEISAQVAAGCQRLAADYTAPSEPQFEIPRLSAEDARRQFLAVVGAGPEARARADLLASLYSDGVLSDKGAVIPTQFCGLFGQGHQFFLKYLAFVAHMVGLRLEGKHSQGRAPAAMIGRALFRPWERADIGPNLRWDTGFWDRQWVDRFNDPATDPVRTEAGAYTLAAFGLPVLTASPATVWRRARLKTMCVQEGGGAMEVVWPIWTRSLSLPGIRALLTHPALYEKSPDASAWSRLGVQETRQALRIDVGKYRAFKRATAVHAPWPLRTGPEG